MKVYRIITQEELIQGLNSNNKNFQNILIFNLLKVGEILSFSFERKVIYGYNRNVEN